MNKDAIVSKYLGRKFGHGKSGCFAFVKAFYKEEFGVTLKNDYVEMLDKFSVTNTPELGDVVVISTHPIVTNHCGVYLGDNEFIHGGHFDLKDEVCVHRTDDFPYAGRVRGFLRHPGVSKE